MKTFIGLVIALASTFAMAQTAEWRVSEVKDKSNAPVGYIYHSYAIGTEMAGSVKSTSVIGLRLICSVKGPANPVIAIYWDGTMSSDSRQSVMWQADTTTIRSSNEWLQDGKIIYSTFASNPELLAALRTGKNISASWVDKYAVRRIATFNLNGFNMRYNDFNSSCKL